MRTSSLGTAVFVLGAILALAYLAGAVLGAVLVDWDDDGGDTDRAFWMIFLLGGCVLLVAGLVLAARSRWLAAVLIVLGAVAGAIATFWTIVVPLAVIALVVLTIMWARRSETATEPPIS